VKTDSKATEKRHPIQVVARRTGLSTDVLRAWEKRYGVVSPARSEGGRRLYSDEDVEHLRLLRLATLSGRNIGQVAELPPEELAALVREDAAAEAETPPARPAPAGEAELKARLEEALSAVEALDAERLEDAISRALLDLGSSSLIDGVLVPLLREIGERWLAGEITPAHEHAASAVVARVVGDLTEAMEPAEGGPRLIAATPVGQRHEFGAMLAAARAAAEGWRVTYLGPDLPASAIAAAARQTEARAVALSLVYPQDDPHLGDELRSLRERLAEEVVLFVGGSGAPAYVEALMEVGAPPIGDLDAFARTLHSVRSTLTAG
jgi:DNA-binding transcriptional MerR regulator/methylmalonyl-CoA mutase cobalamin-binding subunit